MLSLSELICLRTQLVLRAKVCMKKIKTTFEIIFDVKTNLYIFLNFKSLAFLILNTFSK